MDADLVILSIPLPADTEACRRTCSRASTRASPSSTLATTTPACATRTSPALDDGQPESVWVAEQIGRPVIKAFNNILAYSLAELGRPAGTPPDASGSRWLVTMRRPSGS